jgi:hypothetical protein
VGIFSIPNTYTHVTMAAFAHLRLRSASSLALSLFMYCGAVKVHLTRNCQLLTRGPKGIPSPKPGVPNPLPLYIHKLYQRELIPRQLLPSACLSTKRLHVRTPIFYFKRSFPFPSMFCLGLYNPEIFVSHLPSHLLTHLPSYLFNYFPLSLIKTPVLIFTLNIYNYILRTLYIIILNK